MLAHIWDGAKKNMWGWFHKVTTTQQVSGIKCCVYCFPCVASGHQGKTTLSSLTWATRWCASCLPDTCLSRSWQIWHFFAFDVFSGWRTRRGFFMCGFMRTAVVVAYVSSLDCSPCSAWNIASRLQASKNDSGCISYKCCEYIMHSIVCMNPFTC